MGAIFDGTGYGGDGTVWGGELLLGDLCGFERVGMLFPGAAARRRRGGQAAVADGVRVARRGGRRRRARCRARCRATSTALAWRQVGELARTGVASPLTTSMGRLFDAVAALCGIRAEVNYEGQAAVELEAAAMPASAGAYGSPLRATPLVMDARPVVAELVRRRSSEA